MSWLTDSFYQLCTALSLCAEVGIEHIPLPPEDAGAWSYEAPAPKPDPIPIPSIQLQPPPAPPPVQQIVITPPPPAPVLPPAPVPQPHPALVANAKLLELRRLGALEQTLLPQAINISAKQAKDNAPNTNSLLGALPPRATPLDFESAETQERYDASGLDSGLPVDNTRIITEDEPIPVVLDNAINSQIPGKVVLVVSRDIFGSHGSLVLIPKFSRMICNFEEADSANSTRIGMQCNRILSADKRFEILGLSASAGSAQGQSGVTGGVDRRFWEKYGTAFLLTGISTGVRFATGFIPTDTEEQNIANASRDAAEEVSQKFGEISAKALEETVSLKPIIRIAQGTRMSITLGNDWYIASSRK